MYHFRNVKTGSFVSAKHPDESNADTQRAALERQLVRLHAQYPTDTLGLVHIDDKTDVVDWHSPIIIGPKGGAAVIEEASAATADDTFRTATKAYRAAMLKAHNDFLSLAAKLLSDYEAQMLKQAKPRPTNHATPTVVEAGYDARGNWLELGTLKAQKKPRR